MLSNDDQERIDERIEQDPGIPGGPTTSDDGAPPPDERHVEAAERGRADDPDYEGHQTETNRPERQAAAPARGSLAPEVVGPLLSGRLGRPYIYRDRCESTQLLLDGDLPEGATAVCDEQTVGRGRLGRSWAAPPGAAILCSVLLRPPSDARVQELSLVAANAVADMIEEELGLAVQVKWPNDVMVRRYKVAGILGEARGGVVVLGIGLNVNQSPAELPADARVSPGSLRTVDGLVRERAPLLARLLVALERNYDDWLEGGLNALFVSLGARDFLRGRRVSVAGLTAVAVGMDCAGRLELDVDGEHTKVESGEVVYER
jgi:BirA family transcriptional regulator, biotin operon repressor / biotin---[acetyl-CoA-carboxylase] ligase